MANELTLLCLGLSPWEDPVTSSMILRQARERGWRVSEVRHLPAPEPQTPDLLKEELGRPGRILLLSAKEHLPLASRILSDLSGQALRLTPSGILAPAGAEELDGQGYTLTLKSGRVTFLEYRPHRLPSSLPLEELPARSWHCFYSRPEEEEAWNDLLSRLPAGVETAPLLPGWSRLRACGEAEIAALTRVLKASDLKRILPLDSPEEALIRYLSYEGRSLTFAESCTGGRLAAAITSRSGSSAILEGSYVTYANRIKEEWLGVRLETLERYGAVSEECVREMAAGAQGALGAHIALAVSGIAGPTGAVPGKPVGTVWFCLRNGQREVTARQRFFGDRNAVQEQAVLYGLKMIFESEEKIFHFFAKSS